MSAQPSTRRPTLIDAWGGAGSQAAPEWEEAAAALRSLEEAAPASGEEACPPGSDRVSPGSDPGADGQTVPGLVPVREGPTVPPPAQGTHGPTRTGTHGQTPEAAAVPIGEPGGVRTPAQEQLAADLRAQKPSKMGDIQFLVLVHLLEQPNQVTTYAAITTQLQLSRPGARKAIQGLVKNRYVAATARLIYAPMNFQGLAYALTGTGVALREQLRPWLAEAVSGPALELPSVAQEIERRVDRSGKGATGSVGDIIVEAAGRVPQVHPGRGAQGHTVPRSEGHTPSVRNPGSHGQTPHSSSKKQELRNPTTHALAKDRDGAGALPLLRQLWERDPELSCWRDDLELNWMQIATWCRDLNLPASEETIVRSCRYQAWTLAQRTEKGTRPDSPVGWLRGALMKTGGAIPRPEGYQSWEERQAQDLERDLEARKQARLRLHRAQAELQFYELLENDPDGEVLRALRDQVGGTTLQQLSPARQERILWAAYAREQGIDLDATGPDGRSAV